MVACRAGDLDIQVNPPKLKKALSEYGARLILNVKDQALARFALLPRTRG
jgi:hypothetical protein